MQTENGLAGDCPLSESQENLLHLAVWLAADVYCAFLQVNVVLAGAGARLNCHLQTLVHKSKLASLFVRAICIMLCNWALLGWSGNCCSAAARAYAADADCCTALLLYSLHAVPVQTGVMDSSPPAVPLSQV